MIHVCFGLFDKNGRYSKFTGTAILSMFENTRAEVTVHILHDATLTEDNREKFLNLVRRYQQKIEFHDMEKICAADIQNFKNFFSSSPRYKRFSPAALYRLLIPKIFSAKHDKMIYLDSDLIVNMDIKNLWEINLEDKPIAAVADKASVPIGSPEAQDYFEDSMRMLFKLCEDGLVDPNDYFNDGVLLMNLKLLSQKYAEHLLNGIKFLAENLRYGFDQEIFNYCFAKNYLSLPVEFNFSAREHRAVGKFLTENRIVHYIGQGMSFDLDDPFNALWFSYFEQTEWFNMEIFSHIAESFKKSLTEQEAEGKNFALQLTSLVSGKSRAFSAPAEYVDRIKKLFYVRDDEDFLPLVDMNSFSKLADAMEKSRGTKIWFIFLPPHDDWREQLTKINFVENKDFIDATEQIISKSNVSAVDTYKWIDEL